MSHVTVNYGCARQIKDNFVKFVTTCKYYIDCSVLFFEPEVGRGTVVVSKDVFARGLVPLCRGGYERLIGTCRVSSYRARK